MELLMEVRQQLILVTGSIEELEIHGPSSSVLSSVWLPSGGLA